MSITGGQAAAGVHAEVKEASLQEHDQHLSLGYSSITLHQNNQINNLIMLKISKQSNQNNGFDVYWHNRIDCFVNSSMYCIVKSTTTFDTRKNQIWINNKVIYI